MSQCPRWPKKVRYRTEDRAVRHLAQLIHHGMGQQRVYRCGHCDGWHTTSQAIRRRTGTPTPIPAGLVPLLTMPVHDPGRRYDYFPWHREVAA